MRVNLPVTGQEFQFPTDQTLVSVTDLKGRITYANAAFIAVSGYSREELLGQPHNIIRHPDMPEEAFRDLWETIELGLPWTGIVKNRRKSGDHYWVVANAMPMMDGERITGYLSVRKVPSREQVQATEGLYAAMRAEAQAGRLVTRVHRGQVVRDTAWGRVRRLFRTGPKSRLLGIQLVFGGAVACAFSQPALGQGAVILAGGALSSWLLWRLLMRPMQAVVAEANRLASGDLAFDIEMTQDGVAGQLQRALLQLGLNLRTVINDIRAELEQLRTAVSEIAMGNRDLSSRTEAQASSLEQTAASMEQINGTVQQSAASATEAADHARGTADVAGQSNHAVLALVKTMEDIHDSSQKIGEIVHLIEGIAFQTNILALNAAVEAARAGDVGRGFAVVAAEVRALAQRTAAAAKEIRGLIADSSDRADTGNRQAAEAQKSVSEALEAIAKVSQLLGEVRTAATEQSGGVSQINAAIAHMDSITQQNAAMVEQLAATSGMLVGQVNEIRQSLGIFRLAVGERTVAELDAVDLRRQAKDRSGQESAHSLSNEVLAYESR